MAQRSILRGDESSTFHRNDAHFRDVGTYAIRTLLCSLESNCAWFIGWRFRVVRGVRVSFS